MSVFPVEQEICCRGKTRDLTIVIFVTVVTVPACSPSRREVHAISGNHVTFFGGGSSFLRLIAERFCFSSVFVVVFHGGKNQRTH